MARQLAMSTVIAWFGSLSFDKQKDAGRMASWLKSKQDAGEKIEKYLV